MKTSKILCILAAALLVASCNKPAATTQQYVSQSEHPFFHYMCQNGNNRVFYDVYLVKEVDKVGHHELHVRDNDNAATDSIMPLIYPPFQENPNSFVFPDGCPTPLYYYPSPDKKCLFIVTCHMAQENGKARQFQLFKVDCETKSTQFICDCAAITVTDNGLTIAKCAEGTETIHDENVDWNGNITRMSNEEYDYDTMLLKYRNESSNLINGLISLTFHN